MPRDRLFLELEGNGVEIILIQGKRLLRLTLRYLGSCYLGELQHSRFKWSPALLVPALLLSACSFKILITLNKQHYQSLSKSSKLTQ